MVLNLSLQYIQLFNGCLTSPSTVLLTIFLTGLGQYLMYTLYTSQTMFWYSFPRQQWKQKTNRNLMKHTERCVTKGRHHVYLGVMLREVGREGLPNNPQSWQWCGGDWLLSGFALRSTCWSQVFEVTEVAVCWVSYCWLWKVSLILECFVVCRVCRVWAPSVCVLDDL